MEKAKRILEELRSRRGFDVLYDLDDDILIEIMESITNIIND